jgi:hypothetical protein
MSRSHLSNPKKSIFGNSIPLRHTEIHQLCRKARNFRANRRRSVEAMSNATRFRITWDAIVQVAEFEDGALASKLMI